METWRALEVGNKCPIGHFPTQMKHTKDFSNSRLLGSKVPGKIDQVRCIWGVHVELNY